MDAHYDATYGETTVHDYAHWNEEAAIVQAAEHSIYDGEYDVDDFYKDDY